MKRRGRAALLLVDFINPLDVPLSPVLVKATLQAAARTARLKARARRQNIPIIYANDNFGHWTSEFSVLVQRCEQAGGDAARIVQLVGPSPGDHSILKPRHSAFFDTPLGFLLETLRIDVIILTGATTDSCITFTAHDAYLRKYALWIPRDCVAAQRPAYGDATLRQMQRTLKVHTGTSLSGLDRGIGAASKNTK